MSDYIIDRDSDAQFNFGSYLEAYCDNMRTLCSTARQHIDSARNDIQESNGISALDTLDDYIDTILSTLPDTEEYGKHQKDLALRIKEAENYKFIK